MIKTGNLLTFLLLMTVLLSCQRRPTLVIEPISVESNKALMTGKNLDPRLYSTKITFQYYQVDDYTQLSAKHLAFKLDSFVKHQYPIKENGHRKSLTIWFYKKQFYNTYEDLIYEAARESENGALTGHTEDVVALIDLEFHPNGKKSLIKHTYVYSSERSKTFAESDTVAIE